MKNIWLSKAEIMALPTTGPAWDVVKKYADAANGSADLGDQDSNANVCCLAAALVYARTGDTKCLDNVVLSLSKIADGVDGKPLPIGRALALGRELAAYVIAADLIDLATIDDVLDRVFKDTIRELLFEPTTGGPSSLIACQKQRPNNWGMHATASIVAVYAYLGDDAGLKSAANIFKGWMGDRSAYAGFTYGALDWQADPKNPVGVNPKGATLQGHSVDGVLPDDLRRGGGFKWPPAATGYPWEGLQGATVAAALLNNAGYPAWDWCDKAILRAVKWLYEEAKWPAEGDDQWQPWLINAVYGTNYPTKADATPGKNMGFTAWTHAAPVIVKPPVDPPPPPPPPDPPPTDCAACMEELAAVKAELATVAGKLKAITDLVLSQQGD